MAQLITWQTCLWTLSNAHFNEAYACAWIAVASLVCFLAYYAFQVIYERTALNQKIGEEAAERVCRALIQTGVLLLAAFLVYFFCFFKPDAVQAQVSNLTALMGRGDLPVVVR